MVNDDHKDLDDLLVDPIPEENAPNLPTYSVQDLPEDPNYIPPEYDNLDPATLDTNSLLEQNERLINAYVGCIGCIEDGAVYVHLRDLNDKCYEAALEVNDFQPFSPREGDYFDLVELLRPSTVSRCYDRVVRIKVDEDVPEHKPVIISDPKLAAALNEAFDKLDRDQEQLFGEKIKYDDEHD